jgi:hypothetical protein
MALPFQSSVNAEQLMSGMFRILESTVANLEKNGMVYLNFTGLKRYRIKKVYCIFSSPWHLSTTKKIIVEKKELFAVDKALVEDLLDTEEENLEKDYGETEYLHKFQGGIKMLERKVLETKLNGYVTANPYSKNTNHLELSVFLSLSSDKIMNGVKREIQKVFNFGKIEFHSFSVLSYIVLRDIFLEENNFLFLDVSGEQTEILVVKKDIVVDSISFPLGRNFLIRKISEVLNDVSPSNAISSLSLYFDGKTEPKIGEKIKQAIEEAKKDWLSLFYDAFANFSEEIFMPRTVFMAVDDDSAKPFSNFINEGDFSALTLVPEPLNLTLLSHEKIENLCLFGEKAEKDSFIAIESIFLGNNAKFK